jgi:hypothetical protein
LEEGSQEALDARAIAEAWNALRRSRYIGPSYLDDDQEWRGSLEDQRAKMSPYSESEESEGRGPWGEAWRSDRFEKERTDTNQERIEEESQRGEALDAREIAGAWNALRRSRYLGPDYGWEEELERLENRATQLSPFVERGPPENPSAVLWEGELANYETPRRVSRRQKRIHTPKQEEKVAVHRTTADSGTGAPTVQEEAKS